MFRKLSKPIIMGLWLLAAGTGHAYPDKPLKIIVPFSAGTATDVLARDFGMVLSGVIKQPVVVENRTGAEGAIGVQAFLSAPLDGHTALFSSGSLAVLDPLLKNLPYDPVQDFAPVCSIGSLDNIMNMSASLPYKSVAEFITAAKAQPGKFTFAYSSALTRLAGELFQQASGIQLTGVPYRSSANGLTEVAAGMVDLFFIDHLSAGPYYQSGKIRPMVVAGSKPLTSMPDVPTAFASGVPGYDLSPLFSLYLPSKTPAATTNRLRELVGQALKTQAMTEMLKKRGLEESGICGDALVKNHLTEMDRLRQLIKKAGMEAK